MIRRTFRGSKRRATTLVEFAFVAVVLVMVFFGIFEYARFVFLMQVAENAAREGARYAVVHTGDGTTKQQVIDEVTSRMATRLSELGTYTIDVTNVDPNTGTAIANTQWNQASFGNAISVSITGKYKPILPTLLLTSSSIDVKITAMMSSEAN